MLLPVLHHVLVYKTQMCIIDYAHDFGIDIIRSEDMNWVKLIQNKRTLRFCNRKFTNQLNIK
jgi:hypothetical protein